MRFILKLLVNALGVYVTAALLPGVGVENYLEAIVVAVILGLLNAIIKPVLVVLTIPITVFTLGLFLLVINAGIIMLADWLLSSFTVANFWWALAFSIILSVINGIMESFVFADEKRPRNR